jgi:hypothetical protein
MRQCGRAAARRLDYGIRTNQSDPDEREDGRVVLLALSRERTAGVAANAERSDSANDDEVCDLCLAHEGAGVHQSPAAASPLGDPGVQSPRRVGPKAADRFVAAGSEGASLK